MTLAQVEIEGVITSALLKVSFDNVHLAFAMMPGWQLQKSDNEWVSICSLDRKGLVIASLTIMRLDNGKSPKDLAANSPHLVAVTATTIVQNVFGFDATFEPDRTLKLANGVEAYSAYATTNIKGMEQEFLYIDIETTKQGTIILFNSPAGYIAKNRASLEAFLATIELTAK
jgi:hypothetical protein